MSWVGSKMSPQILLVLICMVAHFGTTKGYTPISRGCDQRSCYPATGNLLIGRQDKLSASSTCGLARKERYCILSHLDTTRSDQKCFWCDSTPEGFRNSPRTSHRVSNMVYRWEPPDEERKNQYLTWWQAENGVENVTIQLDLEAEFHVTHIIITFKTFRPKAMYIEKSYDWGQTWTPHRYFAQDCERAFPGVRQGTPQYLNETVCQSRYSRIVPSTQGTVIYRVLPPNINSEGFYPYSKEVQDLLKTTNIRLRMTQLHTLGDENLETDRRDIKEKYYYSIYDMSVRGSCSCYGHADRCLPEKEEHKDIEGMVHGTCDCNHNTKGNNCEFCKDDYNDLPWNPAFGKKKNECKKCNCNDHAASCYFNPMYYVATGNVSGGICIDCAHNTEGTHCQFCKMGFYQDPALESNHPDICKPCDCEPDGTVDEGVCDSRTDEAENMVSGQCHCKLFVGGDRCDRCLNGYWNFTLENPDGCQICTCDLRGIVSNDGCDQNSGDCTCKRNVIGRDCDQCLPQHYGLDAGDPDGCKACECDVGGAYDNDCDVITGQCKCRPNVGGRKCDEVNDGFFTGALDYLLFEGELARGSQSPPTTVIKREPNKPPVKTTWTGPGFMQVYEGSDLTFDIPAIFKDLDYDLVVRHEHVHNYPNPWEKASVELVHLDGPPSGKCAAPSPAREAPAQGEERQGNEGEVPDLDSTGECGAETCGGNDGVSPAEDQGPVEATPSAGGQQKMTFKMVPGEMQTLVEPHLCLEEGKRYQLKLTMDRYDPANPNPKASILIDSISLVPRVESMPIFDSSNPAANLIREAYDKHGCKDYYVTAVRDQVPKECDEPLRSISMYAFEGGYAKGCECDNTGSESSLCDKYTGQCPCKRNVYGRKCSRCAPGFYGFGADGCLPCNCHNIGSLDPFCDEINGQCNCDEKAYGRQCNECQPGFWNFPNCQPCECNGHAATCDPSTGECINCKSATTGFHCEVCLDGYYGEPSLALDSVPCRECPCPNTKANGHSFADKCYLDTETKEPVCECEPEYSGPRCSVCADNFYGNPEIPGGSCVSCNCSENWNFNDTGNCDPSTGKCLKCLFNTEGDHCEHCTAGFWGNALIACSQCVCDLLGTDPNRFDCDRVTGDCHCLPNVEGKSCDRCIENHWKIASGEGCEACDCDPVGSESPTCEPYTGQCVCKEGFGGRKCDQCKENYYGDPKTDSCFPCNCNPQGSQSFQCDHVTGKCICLEGIGGEKCDQCARGFVQEALLTQEHPVLNRTIPHGDLPTCSPCGECFTNWDLILEGLTNETTALVARAEQVKVTGATGAYTRGFEEMEAKLREIKKILDSASVSNDELVAVQDEIGQISAILGDTGTKLNQLDNHLTDLKQAILQGQSQLGYLKADSDNLKLNAQDMKDDITALQETNVEGALNLTREAKRRSDEATARVEQIQAPGGLLKNSEKQRVATETLMNNSRGPFVRTQELNRESLARVEEQIGHLEDKVPGLNKQICDGDTDRTNPCHELCGGAGCDKCGGLSCLNGALSKANEAVKAAEFADKLLVDKDGRAEAVLRNVVRAQQKSNVASEEAQLAYDLASEARNRSMEELQRVLDLANNIERFTSGDQPSPKDVKTLAEQCMAAELNMDPAKIAELAEKINVAIEGVANVDEILADTSDDLARAQVLSESAKRAKELADEQLKHAEKVTQDLSLAVEAQNRADVDIQATQTDIDSARKNLAKISEEMEKATNAADTSVTDVGDLAARQQQLQTEYIKNENRVKLAKEAAADAKARAEKANADLYELNNGFKNVSTALDAKTRLIGTAKDLAVDLQRRANTLSNSATNKLANLYDIEKQFEDNERRLMELSSELVTLNCEMKIHLDVVEDKSNFYRTCSPPSAWSPRSVCQCTPGSPEPSCTARREAVFQDY